MHMGTPGGARHAGTWSPQTPGMPMIGRLPLGGTPGAPSMPATPGMPMSYSMYPTGQLPLPPVPQAPTYHEHTHDVHVLQTWIESVGDNDPLCIKKADLVSEGLIDYIMSRSKQHNEFFTELVRQTRVHCPKVATCVLGCASAPSTKLSTRQCLCARVCHCRLLTRIWSGMFNLLDRATVNYERQFRAGQRLRGKMLRLLQHTKTKLDIYKSASAAMHARGGAVTLLTIAHRWCGRCQTRWTS